MEGDNKNSFNQNIEIKIEKNINFPENVEFEQPKPTYNSKIIIDTGEDPEEKPNSKDEVKKENNEVNKENIKEEKKEEEKEEKEEEEKYDLNKDYNFLSILQFINLFHKVLGLSPISSTELEFSLLHTDIDPLCCNVLSKLLQKKEQHRPTKQNKEKDKDGNFTESNNNLVEKSSNNITQKDKEINNAIFNQENLIQLNEELLKKINYFYKIYIRYLKKIYNITDSTKLLDMIKEDTEVYNSTKYENDFYSFTKFNLSNKYYDDCDIKTELIVKLFRDLNGEHPLRNINTSQELEILMSNKDNEKNNQNYQSTTEIIDINNNSVISEENNTGVKTFESLKTKQKVILLMFFCNYCMSFSGRQPLYLEEIMSNTEENFVDNKKILPLFFDKNSYNYYIFPLNKDCRIYKEKIESWQVSKSIKESFDIRIKNYSELEKLLEEEKDQNIVKILKDKLLEFKANDEEEQKKINANMKKEEIYLKAKKLREMNKNCSEVEKYKNTDYLLMSMSNHMMTRRQLNQITQLSQVSTRNKFNSLILKEKPKELTEEEKHQMKVEKEKLEREKRMEKRNQRYEKMQREKEYELNHPEEAQKLLNKKKNREKERKKNKKRHSWSDEEESEYEDNEFEEELLENYDNSDSEKKTKKKRGNGSLKNIVLSDDDEDIGENMYQPKKKKAKNINNESTDNLQQDSNENKSEIINDGYLIYRYSSNQIELDGNWYVANDPSWKERISYLFSGSQKTKEIKLNIENTDINVNICSANLVECIQLDILFQNCLEFLNGDYTGYFIYYSKTIEERFNINLDIQDSLVKISGTGNNSLGNFELNGYFNFFRNKDIIKEKNSVEDQVIKIAEFKINKNYTLFNPTENEKVIKSYNHRRKKNDVIEEGEE